MWAEYICATTLDEAIQILAEHGSKARIVAGATDLILELERGQRPGVEMLVDVTRLPGLDRIDLDEDGQVHLGPLVTHNQCAASRLLREKAYPLARAAWEVGAPQIRNRATVAGNLITASPANDTITPLVALEAQVTLQSIRGTRHVALMDFYTGVRKTIMQPDEILIDIDFKGLDSSQRGTFIKVALRRAQAVSVANLAIVLTFESTVVKRAAIALGAVAATIVHATEAEAYLAGKLLTGEVIARSAELTMQAAKPIDDIRSSAEYRSEMLRVFTGRGLKALRDGEGQAGVPDDPVTLMGTQRATESAPLASPHFRTRNGGNEGGIRTKVNAKEYAFTSGFDKTLLRLLREEAGLTGTKEGCAEGEWGACTVFLDGVAGLCCICVPSVVAWRGIR